MAVKTVIGQSQEVRDICRILGIDISGSCSGVDIKIRVDECVSVTVHRLLMVGDNLKEVPQMFQLVPVEKPE